MKRLQTQDWLDICLMVFILGLCVGCAITFYARDNYWKNEIELNYKLKNDNN